jgi:hypothetical protein
VIIVAQITSCAISRKRALDVAIGIKSISAILVGALLNYKFFIFKYGISTAGFFKRIPTGKTGGSLLARFVLGSFCFVYH